MWGILKETDLCSSKCTFSLSWAIWQAMVVAFSPGRQRRDTRPNFYEQKNQQRLQSERQNANKRNGEQQRDRIRFVLHILGRTRVSGRVQD